MFKSISLAQSLALKQRFGAQPNGSNRCTYLHILADHFYDFVIRLGATHITVLPISVTLQNWFKKSYPRLGLYDGPISDKDTEIRNKNNGNDSCKHSVACT